MNLTLLRNLAAWTRYQCEPKRPEPNPEQQARLTLYPPARNVRRVKRDG